MKIISTNKPEVSANRNTKRGTAGSQLARPSVVLSDGLSPTAENFMDAAQSAASKKAYASDMRQFAANGIVVPATVVQVINYLAQFAGKLTVATLERRLISLHKAHLQNSFECPTIHITVKRTMQGIRRTFGTKQKQARPMVKDDLLEAMVMIDRQKPVKAARDRALLLVGFASAMRRSELVAVMVEHVTYLPSGIEIFLPHSKTDQERQGRTVFVPYANGDRCPVRALTQWLTIAEIKEGYVFRAVTRHDRIARHGLSAQSVALVVKSSVARVGGDAEKVSGHSLRAGYCTQAAMTGLQPWQIREQTGHKSDVTLAKYIRQVARRKIPSLL
ncbi:MAG: integrase family protein [Polaromonas sp.]|nr:integrase family protein [Polaromonas sp.]